MSTKALGRMYTGNGGPSLSGGGGFDNPSWLSSLFGEDAVTGGQGDEPYAGSGGIFGGQSRRLATMLNAQRNTQLTGIQGQKDIQEAFLAHMEKQAKLENDLKMQLANNETVQKLALEHDVKPEDMGGMLADQMLQNAQMKQGLLSNSLRRPEAQGASNTGVDYELSKINPNNPITASFGGAAAFRTPQGGVGTLTGGGANQETQMIPDPITGMLHTINRQQNVPGRLSLPVNPLDYDRAKNLPPKNDGDSDDSSSINPMPFGSPSGMGGGIANPGVNFNVNASPGLAPVPANNQTSNGGFAAHYAQAGQDFQNNLSTFMNGMMGRPNSNTPTNMPSAANNGVSPAPGIGGGQSPGIDPQMMIKMYLQSLSGGFGVQ